MKRLLVLIILFGSISFGQQQMYVTRKMIDHADSIVVHSMEYKDISETLAKSGDIVGITYTYIDSPEVEPLFADTLLFIIMTYPQGLPCAGPNPEYTFFYSIKSEKVVRIVKE